jgi:L-seryl-tRNA(Ser) seleniumtransferase
VALVLKVHTSNYRVTGFTEEVGHAALATLGVPVVADIGSGLLDAACPWLAGGHRPGLAGEPAARQVLATGATS